MTTDVGSDARAKCVIADVTKVYTSRAGELTVLNGVDLAVNEHECLAIVGKSGCGKSTLLKMIAGLVQPTSGAVLVDDEPVEGPSGERTMVSQADAVFPWYTVRRNVEYGLRSKRIQATERRRRADEFLELVGLTDFAEFWPRQLSGGMRKRVDVARAYAVDPEMLLMDEAFGSLDVITKEQMQVDLLRLLAIKRTTAVFVTHDIEEAIFLGDRVALMTLPHGHIAEVYDVPFERPRSRHLKLTEAFQDLRRTVAERFYETDPSDRLQIVDAIAPEARQR